MVLFGLFLMFVRMKRCGFLDVIVWDMMKVKNKSMCNVMGKWIWGMFVIKKLFGF